MRTRSPQEIARWQAEVRERPKVYAVYERYDGEESLADIYDTRDAAELHAAWLNSRDRSVRTKATVHALSIMNMKLAVERFGAAPETPVVHPSRLHERHAATCAMQAGSSNCTCGGGTNL